MDSARVGCPAGEIPFKLRQIHKSARSGLSSYASYADLTIINGKTHFLDGATSVQVDTESLREAFRSCELTDTLPRAHFTTNIVIRLVTTVLRRAPVAKGVTANNTPA